MVWHNLFAGIALLFVMEGILPFLSPDTWRSTLRRLTEFHDRGVRIMGLVSMLIGLTILVILHSYFIG